MANIKLAAPIAGIRGLVGGLVYSANGSGPFVRAYDMPPNPRTPRQQIQRAYFSSIPAAWRELTPSQKNDWDAFAAAPAQELFNSLGDSYFASGVNWFNKCSTRLLRADRSIENDAPSQARPAAPFIFDFRVTTPGTDPNLTVGGTPSASTFEPGFTPAKAFDGLVGGANRWITVSGTITGWIEYQFPAPVQILKYRIWPVGPAGSVSPRDWDLEYWDGGAWQIADSITGESFPLAQFETYFSPTHFTSARWRINISLNNGSASFVGLDELEMMAATNDASVVIFPEDNFDSAPDWDLVLHVAQAQTVGRRVYYSNFREVLATQTPGRWYHEFQSELFALIGDPQLERSWFCRMYRQTQEGIRSAAVTARAETT
ncbi:hypothetical protein LCGC14_1019350 [marine sediment metagenome]|uniref:F5/8 type C domain-containing protein n=1 Tax=marine sediment metagenome TaxID=412755 RepID=A0A0F9MXV6_9ZZZZ